MADMIRELPKKGRKKNKTVDLLPAYSKNRFRLVVGFMAIGFLGLLLRTAWIQIIEPDRLQYEGDLRSVRKIMGVAPRGIITDRNGEPLAVSVPVRAIYADPKVLHDQGALEKEKAWRAMADVLNVDYAELMDKLSNPKKRFVYLQRQVTRSVGDYIEQLALPGVYVKNEYRRFYPTGEINAQLVGLTNIDDKGIDGVEKSFDDWLTGKPSEEKVRKDRKGHVIEHLELVSEGKEAGNIELSIDERLQTIAYAAVKSAMDERGAESISLILVDAISGEILVMVNAPSFNPNALETYESYKARNRVITDTYEPGSTVKPLIASIALSKGITNWREVFDTRSFQVMGKLITDSHKMNTGTLNDIIRFSSNTGMARITMRMNPSEVMDGLRKFGLGDPQELGLVGEAPGMLPSRSRWSEIEKATLGYGYGLRVSPLQIAAAYTTLANFGVRKPLSILKLDPSEYPEGMRVADEKLMKQMVDSLRAVVEAGTGKQSKIAGYSVAGKTGTAKVAVRGGYGKDYVGTFVGFAPASKPRFVLVAMVNKPTKGGFYGGMVAGPLFHEVISAALQLYNVPPDELSAGAKK